MVRVAALRRWRDANHVPCLTMRSRSVVFQGIGWRTVPRDWRFSQERRLSRASRSRSSSDSGGGGDGARHTCQVIRGGIVAFKKCKFQAAWVQLDTGCCVSAALSAVANDKRVSKASHRHIAAWRIAEADGSEL